MWGAQLHTEWNGNVKVEAEISYNPQAMELQALLETTGQRHLPQQSGTQ